MARSFPAKPHRQLANKGKVQTRKTRAGRVDAALSCEDMARQFTHFGTQEPIEALNQAQADYLASMDANILTFGVGPAGTGKTFLAAARAAQALMAGEVDRIIVTRPAVEAGEKMGYLPGDASEKFAPYLAPFKTELVKRLGAGPVEMYLKNEKILALPLPLMRGWNFDRAFVILDEAQNTTPIEMKMLLTRLGEGSRCVIDGDPRQKDISGSSGLQDALDKLCGREGVGSVCFTHADIVRSGFCQMVCAAYEH